MAEYGTCILNRRGGGKYDWEGARRCASFLRKKKMDVIGVIPKHFWATDGGVGQPVLVPRDIKGVMTLQETSRLDGENFRSSDDEVTIKAAYHRNCVFLDNDNYREWATNLRDDKSRRWLNKYQDILHWKYYFDVVSGTFELIQGNKSLEQLKAECSGDRKDQSRSRGNDRTRGHKGRGKARSGARRQAGMGIRVPSCQKRGKQRQWPKGKPTRK
mmetsp:Transcript_987/g.2227  ORF Transcript_987/g.2227 Transcript_987/m.2227 type:complete len:215 (+) Transcript_987:692-1336(+)